MACHLFSTKPLSEPMLPNCKLDPMEHISKTFCLNFNVFIEENIIEILICEMAVFSSRPQYVKHHCIEIGDNPMTNHWEIIYNLFSE